MPGRRYAGGGSDDAAIDRHDAPGRGKSGEPAVGELRRSAGFGGIEGGAGATPRQPRCYDIG